MATMREIAAEAGVSLKTVSRVFNGDAHVSPEVRKRVRAALAAADYVPNEVAQVFRSGRGRVIGVAVPDLLDPFYAAIVAAVDARARPEGYSTLVTAFGFEHESEEAGVTALLGRQLAGLVLAPGSADQSYLRGPAAALPVVSVDQPAIGASIGAFLHDDDRGAALATSHLIGHGHRRVGFVGRAPHLSSMIARLEGYRRALVEAGIEPDPALVVADVDAPDDVVAGLGLLRSRGVDSVFIADPRTTIASIAALQSGPLPVVGFGDFPLANLLLPSITVIDQDPTRMGSLAAAEILSRLVPGQNSDRPAEITRPPEITRLPVRLIERDSCRVEPSRP